MLNGFEESLKDLDLSDEIKAQLVIGANSLAKGLVDKNQDLLTKLSNGKDSTNASNAELEALKVFKQNADVKSAEDAKSYADAKELMTQANKDALSKIQEQADSANVQLKTLLIDNGLSAALDGVNINKDLKAGAVAMLQAGAIITDGKAMIGDKSLSEAVKEWADTDAGKAFCLAPDNSGGNGQGGNGGQSGTAKDWKTMSVKEKAAYLETK